MSHQNYFREFTWAYRSYISLVFCVVLEEKWFSSRTQAAMSLNGKKRLMVQGSQRYCARNGGKEHGPADLRALAHTLATESRPGSLEIYHKRHVVISRRPMLG